MGQQQRGKTIRLPVIAEARNFAGRRHFDAEDGIGAREPREAKHKKTHRKCDNHAARV